MPEANPEVIRNAGLKLLADFPSGVKQADLFAMAHGYLEASGYQLKDHSTRNALYNLEEKFPEYVIKKKMSYRNVVLIPTNELINRHKSTEDTVPDSIEFTPSEENEYRLTAITYALSEMLRTHELSGNDKMLSDIFDTGFEGLSAFEIEAIVGLKHSLDGLKKWRNAFMHSFNKRR